ncbi:uncharacterized protein LOC114456586 [Xyrichtys novacula]|uniref:Uncharacterized protein LOC114456586 n=1 Tax=Xyrichtys novacula TaxID=13765 RepID=A0AAV1GTH8_XYRNO|nr:uncharacterized protein LOC114456586 [Xyrichtys novacula]
MDRVNKCSVCDKVFTEKSNLTRHMKIHAPKENQCDVCGKSFTTKPQLNSHIKLHQYPSIPLPTRQCCRINQYPKLLTYPQSYHNQIDLKCSISTLVMSLGEDVVRSDDLKDRPFQPKPGTATFIRPSVAGAPVLLVVPAQPQAPNISFNGPSCSQSFTVVTPPAAPTNKPVMPNQSRKPCSACQVPQCGGQRKRYTPSKVKAAGSSQKIFTYCPVTRKSTTSGFEGVVYMSYEHFKSVVDEELERRKNEAHFC